MKKILNLCFNLNKKYNNIIYYIYLIIYFYKYFFPIISINKLITIFIKNNFKKIFSNKFLIN
jgi:hypothetical protein